ncbi:MAG: YraN family protein [Boseongicola sp.]|nr:YraN family protein [Boseongicola sp.]
MDKKSRGLTNYLDGLSAEECVERAYCDVGAKVVKRRWRGKSGEVDLIMQHGAVYIFVEVKKARDFASAAMRVTEKQMQRVTRAAEEFAAALPLGPDSAMRIDVALVNNASESRILENVTL